jgi:hypothetical protein
MDENELAVKEYLHQNDTSPLFFGFQDSDTEPNQVDNTGDLDNLVYSIIRATRHNGSFDEHGELDTEGNRSRSSIDIWRHVKSYRPDVTIFEVMRSMYALSYSEDRPLVGHWCSTVNRRVFRAKEDFPNWNLLVADQSDEYNLILDDWENIGTSTEYYV